MSHKRVVVTGLGATSPVGGDVASTWEALLAGTSGVARSSTSGPAELAAQIAAEVAVEPSEVLDRVKARRLDRVGAVRADRGPRGVGRRRSPARADGDERRPRAARRRRSPPASAASPPCSTNYDTLKEKGPRRVSPLAIPMLMPNGPAANVGLAIGAKAGVHTPVSACASGNEAIALGIDMIRTGPCRRRRRAAAPRRPSTRCRWPRSASMMALSKRNDEPERASRP